MTIIDLLPRFELKNFKVLFQKAEEIRKIEGQHKRETLLSLFPKYVSGTIKRNGTPFSITAEADGNLNIGALFFRWEKNGEEYSYRVELLREPSNLGRGEVVYFLCPFTKRKCRKLYTDGKVIASRWSFPHTYSQRNDSHKVRDLKAILKATEPPEGKNRRTHYKGKLTPYGRKLEKFYSTSGKDLSKRFDRAFNTKRGRPKGSGKDSKAKTDSPGLFLP